MKPYAESCEINKTPILAVLKEIFLERKRVLEIASGTGQHAVYFGRELPHLTWQTSEVSQNLTGIQAWLDEAQLPNVLAPLALDVNDAVAEADHGYAGLQADGSADGGHRIAVVEEVRIRTQPGDVLGDCDHLRDHAHRA